MEIKLGDREYNSYSKFGIEEIGKHLEDLYERVQKLEAKKTKPANEKKTTASTRGK
jgi:hypothetical protein